MATLDTSLTTSDVGEPQTATLYGMGGVGKTSVATAYARRHLDEVGLAWQFSGRDPIVLEAEFGELAAQLGVRDIADTRDPVLAVHGMLAAFQAKWILIFDNVRDRASIERFLPPAGPGRVLITSQNPDWPHGQAFEVPVLGAQVSADFLVSRTESQDRQLARELAEAMDGLPLALEQAAAYVMATGMTLNRYLRLFRQRRLEILSRGVPAGYPETVATTWSLAFSELEGAAPSATAVLRLMAFCAPDIIPLSLLLQSRTGIVCVLGDNLVPLLEPLLESALDVDDAIAALRRYSLVSIVGEGSVLVHRLVQAVTADQIPVEQAEEWRHATSLMIDVAIPEDADRPENWPTCAALMPHAQATVNADADSMSRLANYLSSIGSYTAARELQRRIAAEREGKLGPEHPSTLDAFADFANYCGLSGDAVGARDQLASLLPIYKRVVGADHTDTLVVSVNLAIWTGRAGDPVTARDQLAASLVAHERVLGADHPNTLALRANFANSIGQAGDPATARDQLAALLPIYEREFGPENPATLTLRNSLAHWTGQAGDVARAEGEYVALLAIRERLLGTEHPDTLTTRGSLAAWFTLPSPSPATLAR